MWVSDKEFERLKERVNELETRVGYGWPSNLSVFRAIAMVLDHLGVHIDHRLEHFTIAKKGGPERAE